MQSATLFALAHPEIEGGLYHDENRNGYFTLGWSTKSGRNAAAAAIERINNEPAPEKRQFLRGKDLGAGYCQHSYPLSELHHVLSNLQQHVELSSGDHWNTTSIWLSQGAFSRPNRQKINLAHIAVCWVDLDLRHENSPLRLQRLGREPAVSAVLDRCLTYGIPRPSITLWTGRGLVLKWLIDVLPKSAYPRWAAVQRMLVEAFGDLGADASARDASRILRLPGTWNPKSGDVCEPVHVETFWGEITRYDFDSLANSVLPYTREQIQMLRMQRALARQQRAARLEHHLRVIESGQRTSGNLLKFNPARLAWLQVDDYRALAAARPVNLRKEGWTNTIVWLAASALAVAVWADAERFDREFMALASELAPHWPTYRVIQSVSSVKARMRLMARGEWVEHKGKKCPPVYTPRHETILQELDVKDDEAERLSVIIPSDLKREREAQRKKSVRMAKGALSRETWLAEHAQQNKKPWLELGLSRATWYRKGKPAAQA